MLPREHYLKQAFTDAVHFPNGFEKGGLSDIQARLVRKNGTLINALCLDEVSDPTNDDLHMLKVIANQSAPKTPVEQAWVKYLNIVKNLNASTPKGKAKSKVSKPTAESSPSVEVPTNEKPAPEELKAAKTTTTAIEAQSVKTITDKVEANARPQEKAQPAKKTEPTPTPKAKPNAKEPAAKAPATTAKAKAKPEPAPDPQKSKKK